MRLSQVFIYLVLPYVASVTALPVGDHPWYVTTWPFDDAVGRDANSSSSSSVSSVTTGSATVHCTSIALVTAGGSHLPTPTVSGKATPTLEKRRTLQTGGLTIAEHQDEEALHHADRAHHTGQAAHYRGLKDAAASAIAQENRQAIPNQSVVDSLTKVREYNRHRESEHKNKADAAREGEQYHSRMRAIIPLRVEAGRHSPDPQRNRFLRTQEGLIRSNVVFHGTYTDNAIQADRDAQAVYAPPEANS
ncbi:hypothetical protein FRC17_001316 [Serendipita sp. 399]|nr:hypothetical protein FRC17_001316 [Serendipita sp. 399]